MSSLSDAIWQSPFKPVGILLSEAIPSVARLSQYTLTDIGPLTTNLDSAAVLGYADGRLPGSN
jgi:hypothetical protein